jgi:hypothetical protein
MSEAFSTAVLRRLEDALIDPDDDGQAAFRGAVSRMDAALLRESEPAVVRGADGAQGERGPKGDRGPRGEPGDVGPTPRHRWVSAGPGKGDTALQFEQGPDRDSWGKAVDLKGEPGFAGAAAIVRLPATPTVVQGTGGFVPTRIRAGTIFVVPEDTQALFSAPIDVEGGLEIDGMLIEV